MTGNKFLLAWSLSILTVAAAPTSVYAQSQSQSQSFAELKGQLDAVARELQAQRALIESQKEQINNQQAEIDVLRNQLVAASTLSQERAAGLSQSNPPAVATSSNDQLPQKPVGEGPANVTKVEETVAAVPQGFGVLTRPGHLVIEPSFEYSNSSKNRLVFQGIEIIPGIQLGVIEANRVDHNTMIETASVRYGLAKNLEIEARIPYLERNDTTELAAQLQTDIAQVQHLKGSHLGDIELAARYQINRPVGQKPIFIASLLVKSDTGTSPYGIPYNDAGIATGLATGSGFWAVQPGINVLLPSDPAVIFGGVSYLHNFAKNINRTIGTGFVGRVTPGDAITGNIGFGFALNPRFSFSLGYQDSFIFPTSLELGGTIQRSNRLQVGAFSFGMSYRLSERRTINFGLQVGATSDAPNLDLSIRVPFEF